MVSSVRIYSKLGHLCTNVTNGKLYGSRSQDSDHAIVHLGLNVSSSAVGAWSMAVTLWQREYYN